MTSTYHQELTECIGKKKNATFPVICHISWNATFPANLNTLTSMFNTSVFNLYFLEF